MEGMLLFTMRLICHSVTFWCERHAHVMITHWDVQHACIRCEACGQLHKAKAATPKSNVATHILTKLGLLPFCAIGNNIEGVILV